MDVVVPWAELLLDPPAVAEPSGLSRQFATLKALQRLAEDDVTDAWRIASLKYVGELKDAQKQQDGGGAAPPCP